MNWRLKPANSYKSQMKIPTKDIREFAKLAMLKDWIEPAGVIYAVERGNPNNKSVVFGSSALRAIRDNVISKQTIAVVGVEIDFKSEELEKLIAAVEGVKGGHEYNDQFPGDKR
jgi:hypothetical protein